MARSYHHGDLRNALLDAALTIIRDQGVAALSMTKLAARCEVSSGAPYRHFKDRQALMQALSERANQSCEAWLKAAAEDAMDEHEAFRKKGVAYVQFAVERPVLFALMNDGALQPHEPRPSDPFTAALKDLLAEANPDKPLDPESPILRELAARCMVHGLARYFVDGMLASLGVGSDQAGRLAEALTSVRPPK